MRTLALLCCLMASCMGAATVLSSMVVSGSPSPQEEEIQSHSEVRVDSPRQVHLRTIPDAAVAPIPDLCSRQQGHCCQQESLVLFLPNFVGSGIRILC